MVVPPRVVGPTHTGPARDGCVGQVGAADPEPGTDQRNALARLDAGRMRMPRALEHKTFRQ